MPNRDFFSVNTQEGKNAHIGAALVFYAPFGQAFPTGAGSVVALSGASQWSPLTGWNVLGATKNGIKVERSFQKIDRSSDQSFGPYDERPNNWTAMVSTEILETTVDNLQLAWEGAPVTKVAAVSGSTLAAAAAAGANTLSASAPGAGVFAAGQVISVGNGVFQERHTLQTVSGAGPYTLTFNAGETLSFAQALGAPVFVPGSATGGFGRPTDLTPRVLAVLAPLTITDPTVGAVRLLRTYAFRKVKLQDGAKQINHVQEQDWTVACGFLCFRDPSITDQNQDTYVVYDETL